MLESLLESAVVERIKQENAQAWEEVLSVIQGLPPDRQLEAAELFVRGYVSSVLFVGP